MNINYLVGPISLNIYKKDNRKVMLLGDIHFINDVKIEDSINIKDYLNLIAKKCSDTILFLEGCKQYTPKPNNWLEVIENNPPPMKVIFSDFRSETFLGKLIKEIIELLTNITLFTKNNYSDEADKIIRNIKESISKLKADYYNENISFLKTLQEYGDTLTFIKTSPSKEKKIIIDEIKSNLSDNMSDNMNKFINTINDLDNKKGTSKSYYDIKNYFNNIFLILRLVMDTYILMSLETNKNKNNNIYAGETHIQNYKNILPKLGWKLEYTAEEKLNVLDISNLIISC